MFQLPWLRDLAEWLVTVLIPAMALDAAVQARKAQEVSNGRVVRSPIGVTPLQQDPYTRRVF